MRVIIISIIIVACIAFTIWRMLVEEQNKPILIKTVFVVFIIIAFSLLGVMMDLVFSLPFN